MFDKTVVPPTPSHIVILGGGLAGLSSAYHLSRKFPNTPITVLEEQPRLGGWVRSERVKVQDDMGHMFSVVLEAGPRTVRPIAKSVLELINLLEVKSSLVLTPKMSAAAKNHFLHIPGTPGLQMIPSSMTSLFSSLLARIMVPAIICEPFRRANRPFARTFGSAVGHGIYATDSRNLSVKAAFPSMWDAEENGGGSVVWGFLKGGKKKEVKDDYVLGEMETVMKGVSAYSFKDGMGTLVDVLVDELKQNPRVQLQSGVGATCLHIDSPQNSFKITTTSDESLDASHVVSTLPLPILSKLLPSSTHLPHLDANLSASVTLVTLVFPLSDIPLHPPGSGYFIPRPSSGYDESNPGIIGTVLESSALPEQDTGGLTKITVMLGGPHPLTPDHTSVPVIMKHLTSHLGHSLPEPLLVRTHSHASCIPTPSVGHVERMDELRAVLKGAPWEGRLEIIGAGVGGVGVGDVEAGKRVGQSWM